MKQMEKKRKMEEADRMMRKLNYLDNFVLCKKNPNVRDYFELSGNRGGGGNGGDGGNDQGMNRKQLNLDDIE